MKNFLFCCFFLLSTSLSCLAQTYSKGAITFTNTNTLDGSIRLDYDLQQVVVKENNKERGYDFSSISKLTLNKVDFDKLLVNENTYFTNEMVIGNASLYQINKQQYLITKKDGIAKTIDLKKEQNTIPGILAVLFNNCNNIRQSLNKVDKYNGAKLRMAVDAYNNCDYQTFAPTDKEVQDAARHNTDKAQLYVGVGGGLSSIRFFDANDAESLGSIQAQLGVRATPSFFGNLQGNLYFSLEAQAAVAGDKEYQNVDQNVNFNLNSFRLLLGLEYAFNKNKNFKPFVGIAAGLTSDHYKGSVDGNNFKISGGNPIFAPKAGFRYLLSNNDHIGLTISYITDYENDLTFPTTEEIIPLVVEVQTVTLGIQYQF